MKIQVKTFNGRRGWNLNNGAATLSLLQGGGHIASVVLNAKPSVNPLWKPVWKSMEPWQYKARDASRYGTRLLASIAGHNLCLGHFGVPTDEEARAGLGVHGEAPVARWRPLSRVEGRERLSLTVGCDLPIAGMRFARTVSTRRGSNVFHVREQIRNLTRRDVPYTMCQHVTVAAPFLEKGVTVFDMPATKGHTFPWRFEDSPRLKQDTAFRWPDGPGVKGEAVDLRMIAKRYRVSSDFSTQLIDPRRKQGWFTAMNPRQGVALAYVWNREDFPWVGNWEENYGRKFAPWDGKSLTRGMEFANTPFPTSLRNAVDMGRFHGLPTFRWLPALSRVTMDYAIVMVDVPSTASRVLDVKPSGKGYRLDVVV